MMKSPDKIKKSLRIHSLNHPSGCIGCAYRGDNATKIPNGCADKLFKDVREYIKQLEAQVPHWISVEERLPEKTKEGYVECVLVTDGYMRHMAYFANGAWHFCDSGEMKKGMFYKVTHWMPLPNGPKEEEKC